MAKRRYIAQGMPTVPFGAMLAPQDVSARITDDDAGGPDVFVDFEMRNGVPEAVRVEMVARMDGRPVRTSDMYQLALDQLAVDAFAAVSIHIRGGGRLSPSRDEGEALSAGRAVVEAQGGRRAPTRDELAEVATIYRTHAGRDPVVQIKKRRGYPSMRTAYRRVQQARAAGLLPPSED